AARDGGVQAALQALLGRAAQELALELAVAARLALLQVLQLRRREAARQLREGLDQALARGLQPRAHRLDLLAGFLGRDVARRQRLPAVQQRGQGRQLVAAVPGEEGGDLLV